MNSKKGLDKDVDGFKLASDLCGGV